MTTEQIKQQLTANRELVISFYNENVKSDNFYTLKWFMIRVMDYANISWTRRKNIAVKDVNSVLKSIIKDYPQIAKGYKSNWQKAVNYYGYEQAKRIADAK